MCTFCIKAVSAKLSLRYLPLVPGDAECKGILEKCVQIWSPVEFCNGTICGP
uniref:Uncharacterized protein n=1 Tax=Anguilla anguilla TaxID=7936 RepID=A0A0E9PP72_ANGAN